MLVLLLLLPPLPPSFLPLIRLVRSLDTSRRRTGPGIEQFSLGPNAAPREADPSKRMLSGITWKRSDQVEIAVNWERVHSARAIRLVSFNRRRREREAGTILLVRQLEKT